MITNQSNALILFSGQQDAVNISINYAKQNPKKSVSLLYIKNIGYRPKNIIPQKIAHQISALHPNIDFLFVADGSQIQTDLIKAVAISMNINYINTLCIICQFSLNLVYCILAKKLGVDYIIANDEVLGAGVKEILHIPYVISDSFISNYKEYLFDSGYLIKSNLYKNKCILAYTHNYAFEYLTHDILKLKEILTTFAGTANYSISYKKIKLH